jgi:AcrR family transcriptional regulator
MGVCCGHEFSGWFNETIYVTLRNMTTARNRGRPKTAASAVGLQTAQLLLAEGGPGAVTMDAVAARSGVGKPTLYRYWSNRHDLLMAALMDGDVARAHASKHSAVAALQLQLEQIVERFATPTGRHIAMLLSSADRDSEISKAFRNHFILARRSEGAELLRRAIDGGELPPDTHVDAAVDAVYGAVFFRLLLGHAPLDRAFARAVLKQVVG